MHYRLLSLGACLILLAGCSFSSVQTDRAYNELGRSHHLELKGSGYIIGIEKRNHEELGLPRDFAYEDHFQSQPGRDAVTVDRNRHFRKVTANQDKAMLVTQVTNRFSRQRFLANAYERDIEGELNYSESYGHMEKLFDDMSVRLSEAESRRAPYTHILLMSMGWNNDQVESIWRYNRILKNLQTTQPADFRPLVVGFTWPSAWFTIEDSWIKKNVVGHLGSYFTKADDADEIGYTFGNWAINYKLPKAIEAAELQQRPKVVAIGHSMGARLLSRAIFSRPYLKKDFDSESPVDLFLGLQGAFSVNRFLVGEGNEGHPYSKFNQLPTKMVLTTSLNDNANPMAFFVTNARHVGGKYGLLKAQQFKQVFDVQTWKAEQTEQIPLPTDRVLLVDTSAIVNDVNGDGVSGHNDILDEEMAELMWHFIGQL